MGVTPDTPWELLLDRFNLDTDMANLRSLLIIRAGSWYKLLSLNQILTVPFYICRWHVLNLNWTAAQ